MSSSSVLVHIRREATSLPPPAAPGTAPWGGRQAAEAAGSVTSAQQLPMLAQLSPLIAPALTTPREPATLLSGFSLTLSGFYQSICLCRVRVARAFVLNCILCIDE